MSSRGEPDHLRALSPSPDVDSGPRSPVGSNLGYVSLINLPTRMQFKRRNEQTVTAVLGEAMLLESLQSVHKSTVGTGQLNGADPQHQGLSKKKVVQKFREGSNLQMARVESMES